MCVHRKYTIIKHEEFCGADKKTWNSISSPLGKKRSMGTFFCCQLFAILPLALPLSWFYKEAIHFYRFHLSFREKFNRFWERRKSLFFQTRHDSIQGLMISLWSRTLFDFCQHYFGKMKFFLKILLFNQYFTSASWNPLDQHFMSLNKSK